MNFIKGHSKLMPANRSPTLWPWQKCMKRSFEVQNSSFTQILELQTENCVVCYNFGPNVTLISVIIPCSEYSMFMSSVDDVCMWRVYPTCDWTVDGILVSTTVTVRWLQVSHHVHQVTSVVIHLTTATHTQSPHNTTVTDQYKWVRHHVHQVTSVVIHLTTATHTHSPHNTTDTDQFKWVSE